MAAATDVVKLPPARTDGPVSLETTLKERRSVRSYTDTPLTLAQLGQMLWAAQGLSDPRGYRTAPSAGATYPLELVVAAGNVEGLPAGVYRYRPAGHELAPAEKGDKRAALSGAALSQGAVAQGAAVVAICAVYERTLARYGERGIRYVHMEAGHAAQNLCLQAVSLGLSTVPIGAFRDRLVQQILSLAADEMPLYLIPVGK